MWFYAIFFYLIVEYYRYIKYTKLKLKLNKMLFLDSSAICKSNNKKLLFDLENHILEPNLKDLSDLYNVKSISKRNVGLILYDVVNRDPIHKPQIKRIINKIDYNKDQIISKELNSWFQPLFMDLIYTMYDKCMDIYLESIGYTKTRYKKCTIYQNKFIESRETIVFFHASIGGIGIQINVLRTLDKNFNVIIPSLDLSFEGKIPKTVDAICDSVLMCIKKHNIDAFCVMGHSIGSNFCCYMINAYPQKIKAFFCIEGQIFVHRAFRSLKSCDDLFNIPICDVLSILLLHRNIYTQFFIRKIMRLGEIFIYSNPNIPIHMFHSKYDTKFDIDSQIEYSRLKDIPITCHIYKGKDHGSFIMDKGFREYVFEQINLVLD